MRISTATSTSPPNQRRLPAHEAEITGGQVSDDNGYDPVMEGGPDPTARLADRGYDADRIRQDVEGRGGTAVGPMRKGRRVKVPIDDLTYALRNVVERCINKLKNARRVAIRYDETATSYLGFVHVVAIRLWAKHFVNKTLN